MKFSNLRSIISKYNCIELLKKLDEANVFYKNNNTKLHLEKLIKYGFDDDTIIELMRRYASLTPNQLKSPSKEKLIFLYTKEIGEKLYNEYCKKNSESGKLSWKNPNRKASFEHFFPEYWIKKGYTEEEANEIVNKRKKKAADASRIASHNRPSYLTNVHIDYYINKGMTIEEAEKALKERQNTVSLKSFQRKYGEEEGLKRFNDRNKKWQDTLNNKPEEEKQRLYEARIAGFRKASSNSISIEETSILNLLEEKYNIKIERQIGLDYQGKIYLFDGKYKDVIIEFNGDYWHCNPLKYESSFVHPTRNCTAKDIWNYDYFKCNTVAQNYRVFIIWENELNDTDKIIERFKLYL